MKVLGMNFEKKSKKFVQKIRENCFNKGKTCAFDAYKATHPKFGDKFALGRRTNDIYNL